MKHLILLLVPGLAGGLIAYCLTPVSIWLARRVGAIDAPGPRRVHSVPVPRLGGLAVVASVVMVIGAGALGFRWAPTWMRIEYAAGMLAGLVPILAVSVLDDIRHVRALPKLLGQVAGAMIAMSFGIVLPETVHLFDVAIPLGWLAYPLSIVWLIGVTNAFNLVDGLDGLSAGLGFISCASLAAVVLVAAKPDPAAVAIVLGGSLLGFLPYNLHPARVFLGDSGATAIGFMLGCLTLTSSALLSAGFATLLPILLVAIPVADTLVSILRRGISRLENGSGSRVYEADRNHIHHRLLDLGLSHRNAVLILYGVGGLLSGVALLSLLLTRQQTGLLLLGLLLAGFLGLQRLGYGEFALIRRGVALKVYDLPMMRRAFFVVFVDVALIWLALYLSAALKLDSWSLSGRRALVLEALTLLVPAQVGAFAVLRVYKDSWRLAGVHEFQRLGVAIVTASLGSLVLSVFLGVRETPPTLFLIYGFVALSLLTASRVSYRVLDQARSRSNQSGIPALIYGAGLGGAATVRELLSNSRSAFRPIGFIDDDSSRKGKSVNGYEIICGLEGLNDAITRTGARVVVISSKGIPRERVLEARRICERAGVRLLRMNIEFEEAMPASGAGAREEAAVLGVEG